jgi:hypothetical protein
MTLSDRFSQAAQRSWQNAFGLHPVSLTPA